MASNDPVDSPTAIIWTHHRRKDLALPCRRSAIELPSLMLTRVGQDRTFHDLVARRFGGNEE
jgi:hypothetical protein